MSGEAFRRPSPDGSHDDGPDDPFQTVVWERYAAHARATLIPMIQGSAIGLVLSPPEGQPDVKQALELGMMILMDKPFILITDPSRTPPPKLLLLADVVLEGPVDRPGFTEDLAAACREVSR